MKRRLAVQRKKGKKRNFLTLFRKGGRAKKAPPTSFSPVTSTNVKISTQNFLAFRFKPFATLV